MANTRVLQRSFAGGEMAPEMYGRIDDVKYQTGAALVSNFIVTPQGPLENRPGFKLVREVKDSTKKVRVIPFTFSTDQTMVIELGAGYFRFHTDGATLLSGGVPYEVVNPYAESDLFDIHYVQSADVLTLVHPNHAPRELRRLGAADWELKVISFNSSISAPTGVSGSAYIPASSSINADTYETMKYVVTAIAQDEISESAPSAVVSVSNNIFVNGARNTISWSAVSGAFRYHVYKEQGGIYGYIGGTSGTSIVDNNIGPDFSLTPPTYDNVFTGAGNYPGAVSYFEQRRCFAGTINDPQTIWMTKSGTESNMSYGIPVRDDDRIKFRVAAREANTIRHIAPINELILLTGSAEWRVTSVNTDAITPTSISVRPQSFVGASNVQPVVINNTMLYAASRGGHIRELGYNWQAGGFVTNDLSLRAAHLFDNREILDLAYAKAPMPLVWMISCCGRLLGMTYVPEQEVNAIHQHQTKGFFESCTVVAEGIEDHLYVVTRRMINGQEKRFIERMESRMVTSLEECFFMDCGLTYDGRNTTNTTITVSGGTNWDSSEILTLTASANLFSAGDVDDVIVMCCTAGYDIRFKILEFTSATQVKVKTDNTVTADLRNVASTRWAFARDTISGLNHLEGEEVSIMVNGAVHPLRTVTDGKIVLNRPSSLVHIGLGYESDLQTLPVILQGVEGFGQGRYKNINHAWLRVNESSGIFIGPNEDDLVEAKQRTNEPYGSPPELKSEEIRIMLTPSWGDGGEIFVKQRDPLPLTIVGMTLEVAIGG